MQKPIGTTVLEITLGDITKECVDAIVNAANHTLLGGGGVDGAIHRVGGPSILAECRALGGCDTGDAKITTGGNLPAKYVIHTVGPVYKTGLHGEPELLARCHRRSLDIAAERRLKSIAFPAISCGVYGYPVAEASVIAIASVADWLRQNDNALELVRFVTFGQETYQAFLAALESLK
ncbi:MAG: O-acetyl-ADP-ribose deacetylase [Candidatus Hydrogenedentota bacterium]